MRARCLRLYLVALAMPLDDSDQILSVRSIAQPPLLIGIRLLRSISGIFAIWSKGTTTIT